MKKIIIATSTLLVGFTLSACSFNSEELPINNDNDENIETTESTSPPATISNEAFYEITPERRDISDNVASFFVFSVQSISTEDEVPTDSTRLEFYENLYDLNEYINYNDLSEEQKIELHDSIAEHKALYNEDGPRPLSFKVEPGLIKIEDNIATVPGNAIMVKDPEIGNSHYTKNTRIKVIQTNDGWKLDGNSLIELLPLEPTQETQETSEVFPEE